jgi:hypothetical protein
VDLIFNIGGRSVAVRADVLVAGEKPGYFVYVEAKFSPAASYTEHQRIVIPELVKAGEEGLPATVGSRYGNLAPGAQIQVVFQGDVWTRAPILFGQ